MNRKLRLRKSPYQLKDEQVIFLLEDIKKKTLKEYKKIVETKGKKLAQVKKNTERNKNSLCSSYKRNQTVKRI